jgi:hypothetical protein
LAKLANGARAARFDLAVIAQTEEARFELAR